MLHRFAAILFIAAACLAGCGDKDKGDQKVDSWREKDKGFSKAGAPPEALMTLTAEELAKRVEKAGEGQKLVRREYHLNGLADQFYFTMLVPHDAKDDWFGRMTITNKRDFNVDMDFASGLSTGPKLSKYDDDHVVIQEPDLIILQDRYDINKFHFRMRIPMGYLDVDASGVGSENVKSNLANTLLVLHCLKTFKPRLEPEPDPVEGLRQLGWRLIERDGKIVEVVVDDSHNTLLSARAMKQLLNFKDMEKIQTMTRPFMDDAMCEEFTQLKNLREVKLIAGGVTDISDKGLESLCKIPRLRVLVLEASSVTAAGWASLPALKNLQRLSLHGGTRAELKLPALAHLTKLPELRDLSLAHHELTDELVAGLAPLTKLRKLDLSGGYGDKAKITDKSADTLLLFQDLESLDLSRTQLADAGLLRLAALPKLRELKVQQTDVTEETVKQVMEKYVGLKVTK